MSAFGAACPPPVSSLQGTRHPRLQIITIAQLLQGNTIDRPPSRADATFKKAPRVRPKRGEGQLDLHKEQDS